ncbi:hypothetical protein, partial [Dankookia rubra]
MSEAFRPARDTPPAALPFEPVLPVPRRPGQAALRVMAFDVPNFDAPPPAPGPEPGELAAAALQAGLDAAREAGFAAGEATAREAAAAGL